MYALAPLSGRFTDRFGSQPVILSGLATLTFAGLLAAAAPAEGGPALLAALFLLGFGWNLCFVAGSNLLASGLALAERTRLQGVTDTIIWSAAAVASLSSGVIVALVTYTGLGLLPAFLVMIPAWLLIRRRQAIARSLVIDEADARLEPHDRHQHPTSRSSAPRRSTPRRCLEHVDGPITPAGRHYVRNHFAVPEHDGVLRIDGSVARPMEIRGRRPSPHARLDAGRHARVRRQRPQLPRPARPRRTVELGAVGTAEWTGLPLSAVLAEAGAAARRRSNCSSPAPTNGLVGAVGREMAFQRSLPIGTRAGRSWSWR